MNEQLQYNLINTAIACVTFLIALVAILTFVYYAFFYKKGKK